MASRPKRPCAFPNCPALTTAKHGYCLEHKKLTDQEYSKQRTYHKKYYTKRWQKLRLVVLSDQPFCADPYSQHSRYVEGRAPATEIDHIDGDSDNDLMDNLQALCKSCHSRKTALEQDRWGKRGVVYTAPYSTAEVDDKSSPEAEAE